MSDGQRVLVTGSQGYLGSVMTEYLVRAGHSVCGLDAGFFDDCTLVPGGDLPVIDRDIRDLGREDLEGFDAIVHLAALSNDPIGNLNADWTRDINLDASVRLAELARDAGVQRFLFSSSCIMYGASSTEVVDETSPLDPKTEYARSKVACESAIAGLARDDFSPTFLRNGTVYGLSPRMRFDTVLNDLVAAAVTTGKVVVRSNGRPWRPVVHVEDVARSFGHVLAAPREAVHNQAFNNGAEFLNRRVGDLAELAAGLVPGCELEVRGEADADQRTYRADFSKFAATFPDFEFEWTPERGGADLADRFRAIGLTAEMVQDARFTRLRWLRHLLDSGHLDDHLRWTATAGVHE
jgi:nucleoside-diphosphate-sugar epimerase